MAYSKLSIEIVLGHSCHPGQTPALKIIWVWPGMDHMQYKI